MKLYRTCAAWCLVLFVTAAVAAQSGRIVLDDADKPLTIHNDHVLVVVPRSRMVVTAYSLELGAWNSIPLTAPLPLDVNPILASGMVALQFGQTVYAYSAQAGAWDHVVLPADNNADVVVEAHGIMIRDNHSLYVFSQQAASWSGVDLVTGEPLKVKRLTEN